MHHVSSIQQSIVFCLKVFDIFIGLFLCSICFLWVSHTLDLIISVLIVNSKVGVENKCIYYYNATVLGILASIAA